MLQRLKQWKTSIVGIVLGVTAILGWTPGAEAVELVYTIIEAVAALVLLFAKD